MVKGVVLNYCDPQSKILWHMDRVCEWYSTGTTDPILFEIDASNVCNHNCPWCTFAELRKNDKSMLSLRMMKDVLDRLCRMKVKAINWTGGGEPLCNPDIVKAIKFAKGLGFSQGMFTNGSLLSADIADQIMPNLTWLRVSLDSHSPDVFADMHGANKVAFWKIIGNIKHAVSIKDRGTIGIGYLINQRNYRGIIDITKMAQDIGVDYVHFKPVLARVGEEQIEQEFIEDSVVPLIKSAKKYARDKFAVMSTDYRFKDITSPETDYGRTYSKCYSIEFQGAIGADGKVYICDHHKGEEKYCIGSLHDNNMFEIWNCQKKYDVINDLNKSNLSQCQVCCRNHELNKWLWHVRNVNNNLHPDHI